MMDTSTLVSMHETDSLRMVADSAKDFAEKYLKPYVMEWDETQHFPVEAMRKAGELGFLGVIIPSEYGGAGMTYHEYIAIIEQISIVDPSIGLRLLHTIHFVPITFIFLVMKRNAANGCLN